LRRRSLPAFAFSTLLALALILFTVASGASDMRHGVDGHHPVTLHGSGTHHTSHDAQPGDHQASAWCGAACAATVVALAERGPERARARGVAPAITSRTAEHSPDDPLPPPRVAA
jgi:hypothetical protein